MAITVACQNKGCGKLQAPYLDQETNKTFCSECHGEVQVGDFMKRQLLMNKQFRKREQKSFSVKCEACRVEARPKIVGGEVICSACEKKLDKLSPAFITMLKLNLSKADQEI